MKKRIVILLLCSCKFFLFSQSYNFYERNLMTGEIVYLNLDYETKFKYDVATNNKQSIVTGYYYNSENIKFIDTLLESKIQKIEYFDKTGNSLYTSTYRYDDKKLSSVTTVFKTNNKIFYSVSFDAMTKTFNSITHLEYQKDNDVYKISEVKLDSNNRPVSGILKVFSSNGIKTDFSYVNEKWKYDDNKKTYQVLVNNQRVYCLENSNNCRKITNFQNGKEFLVITESFDDKQENRIVILNGKKTVNGNYEVCFKTKTFKHLLDNDIQNKKREIFSVQDEFVFLTDEHVTTHQLLLPLDILEDNDFHQGYMKIKVED